MALRLLGLTRRFGAQTALDDVSLHVRDGDCYGFLGHNGAGKTTALRIALGLEHADAGRVLVEGFDAARFPREARARMGGLVETPGFHGHLDATANLVLLARLAGMDVSSARSEVARALTDVGLDDVGGKRVRAFSQGMRQRLGIAQALLGRPRILLLDEPLNGLDPEGIAAMRDLLQRLTRGEGMTVLLSSHQLADVSAICNRVGILREGRLLVEEETATLIAAERARYVLATDDVAAAERALQSMSVVPHTLATGEFEVSLGDRDPAAVARDLVTRGVALRAWTPRPPSLEAIYLRLRKDPPGATKGNVTAVPESDPSELLAPRRATWRVMRHEFTRFASSVTVPVLMVLPAIVGVRAVWSRHADTVRDRDELHGGTLASASGVTGFEAVGVGLQAALPPLLFVLAALASQSIAGEISQATMRNVLLRPLTRTHVAAGKSASVLVLALLGFAIAVGAVLAAAAHWFRFGDVVEYLGGTGKEYVMPGGEAVRMWPAMASAGMQCLPVLAAFVAVGFLAGSVARSSVAGLAGSLGGLVLLETLRIPGKALGFEGFLPTVHASRAGLGRQSDFRDSSAVQAYIDTTGAIGNVHDPYPALHVVVPLAWAVLLLLLAGAILRRRSIR